MSPTPLLSIGVVGATGIVGQEFIKLLIERRFPVENLRLFASEQSVGSEVKFREELIPVQALTPKCFEGLDLVFFSSGDEISKEWVPVAVRSGAFAVDNSAAFRMNPEVALVVPEVNEHRLPKAMQPVPIANPNCSTIQLVVALNPLKKAYGLEAVRVASYQSVSGAGKAGIDELQKQSLALLNQKPLPAPSTFPHTIAFANLPHIGSFDDSGFCSEELKIMAESKRILELPKLKISAFTVRTPTLNAHSEAVWVTLNHEVTRQDLVTTLRRAPGLIVEDDPIGAKYPLNTMASGTDGVYVGRIHRDQDDPKTWLMWIVSDNLRKGAALNGIQIAEQIFDIQKVR